MKPLLKLTLSPTPQVRGGKKK